MLAKWAVPRISLEALLAALDQWCSETADDAVFIYQLKWVLSIYSAAHSWRGTNVTVLKWHNAMPSTSFNP